MSLIENKDYIKEELSEDGQFTDIEAEDDEQILEPFDPDSISIEQKVVPMETLIRRLKQGSIRLSPDFQRKEVWDKNRQSRLIESLMLRIPLPMFYVAADENGRWEVVDGLQRLSTIRDYLIGDNETGMPLVLKKLEFLGEKYNNTTFKKIEIDSSHQRVVNAILETEMRFTVINPGTPEAVKRNIFKRINTGGMPLTSQEIRHALYQGPSTRLLNTLVNSEYFKNSVGSKINDTRMGARELALRFIAFFLFERESYKNINMDTWLSNAMRVVNILPEMADKDLKKIYNLSEIPLIKKSSIKEIEESFRIAMIRAKIVFQGHAFRKSLPGDERKTPINKSLFETWSNILAELSEEEFENLNSNKKILYLKYKELLEQDPFASSISRHSSDSSNIQYRYKEIYKIVRETIFGEQDDNQSIH